MSFGGDTKSRRPLLSGVYARGSKRSHQSALEMCNLSWTPHSSLEKDNSLNHSCVSTSMGSLEQGRDHTTALGPERFRNATGCPCSHLFHCVQSFRNEPTTLRCDRSGTVPEGSGWLCGVNTTGCVPVATR